MYVCVSILQMTKLKFRIQHDADNKSGSQDCNPGNMIPVFSIILIFMNVCVNYKLFLNSK